MLRSYSYTQLMGWKSSHNLHVLGNVVGGGYGGREVDGAPHRKVGPCSGALHDVVVHGEAHVEGVHVERALHDREVHGEVCMKVVFHNQVVPCDVGDDGYRVGAILPEHGVEDEDYSHHLVEYVHTLLHLLGEMLDIWSSRSYRHH